jgi:FkbM family methyltransferase
MLSKYWRFQTRAMLTRIGLWSRLERWRLRWRFQRGVAHEADFRFFRHVAGAGRLFVDIGANLGQSALSFRLAHRQGRILSFEPNPAMAPALRSVKKLLGESFDFRMHGLGARTETKTLFIPIVRGIPFPQCATFRRECLEDNEGVRQLFFAWTRTDRFTIVERPLPLVRFDELGLNPDFIKIDAEGGEADIVAGMTETLSRCRPLLMTEGGGARELLLDRGYQMSVYHADRDVLCPLCAGDAPLNVFFVPNEMTPELRRIGAFESAADVQARGGKSSLACASVSHG